MTPMTDQDFYEFQTTVEGSAASYENQPNGNTIIKCADGARLLVTPDGDSREIMTEAEAREFVAVHGDDDEMSSDQLTEVFRALCGRDPSEQEQEALWSHCCAMA